MAIRSSLIAWAILMFFALLGRPMLHALGISLASFRIAGGIMLFFIAIDMVFERRTERREKRAQSIEGTPEAEDISVFPMAMPMITGPGSIASAMLWVSRAEDPLHVAVVLAAITTVILITMVTLLAAGPLMRLIGDKMEAMITRILGVILAALAAQFVDRRVKTKLPARARLAEPTLHIRNGKSFGNRRGSSNWAPCPGRAAHRSPSGSRT